MLRHRPASLPPSHVLSRLFSVFAIWVLAASCGGDGPTPPTADNPGTVDAVLIVPSGSPGAARVRFTGPGIEAIRTASGQIFQNSVGSTVDVIVVLETPGQIRLSLDLADKSRLPTATVIQVSDENDELRELDESFRVRFES